MRRVLLVLTIISLLAPVPNASAQGNPDDLSPLVERLTALWARNDASRLVSLGADPGVELDIHGTPMGPLAGRRAAAALRHLFGGQETVSVRVGNASRVVGADDRAFLELRWEVRQDGAAMTEHTTVFLGLIREPTGWRVSQIRILP